MLQLSLSTHWSGRWLKIVPGQFSEFVQAFAFQLLSIDAVAVS